MRRQAEQVDVQTDQWVLWAVRLRLDQPLPGRSAAGLLAYRRLRRAA